MPDYNNNNNEYLAHDWHDSILTSNNCIIMNEWWYKNPTNKLIDCWFNQAEEEDGQRVTKVALTFFLVPL